MAREWVVVEGGEPKAVVEASNGGGDGVGVEDESGWVVNGLGRWLAGRGRVEDGSLVVGP